MQYLYTLPEGFTTQEKLEIFNNFTMVTFVRHPFVRLVSTFKDKIMDGNFKDWRKIVKYNEKKPYEVIII